jgi:predicted nucleic acid-binding protein
MTAKVFIDTTVLMELFFRRSNYELAAKSLMALSEENIVCASLLSVSTLLYYVEAEKFDKKIAHNFVRGFKILDMTEADYKWAEDNDQGDFEDALQVACARRHGCSDLFTMDKKFGVMYDKYLSVRTISKG